MGNASARQDPGGALRRSRPSPIGKSCHCAQKQVVGIEAFGWFASGTFDFCLLKPSGVARSARGWAACVGRLELTVVSVAITCQANLITIAATFDDLQIGAPAELLQRSYFSPQPFQGLHRHNQWELIDV